MAVNLIHLEFIIKFLINCLWEGIQFTNLSNDIGISCSMATSMIAVPNLMLQLNKKKKILIPKIQSLIYW